MADLGKGHLTATVRIRVVKGLGVNLVGRLEMSRTMYYPKTAWDDHLLRNLEREPELDMADMAIISTKTRTTTATTKMVLSVVVRSGSSLRTPRAGHWRRPFVSIPHLNLNHNHNGSSSSHSCPGRIDHISPPSQTNNNGSRKVGERIGFLDISGWDRCYFGMRSGKNHWFYA
jgi:hypothetical protein